MYLIRPGENLTVVLIGTRLQPLRLVVDAESRIVHQELGVIDLAGRTLSEAREVLFQSLGDLYNVEQIAVSVQSSYRVPIQVTGAVAKPGRYTGYTSQRVSDIIDSAGGLAERASSRQVLFFRENHTLRVDLDRYNFFKDINANPCLYAGSSIHVPVRSDSVVRILGEVNQPRMIELLPGDDLDLLLALAGGPTGHADVSSCYAVNDSARDLSQSGGITPGDVIVVPSIVTGDAEVVITGAIARPGYYPYSDGMKVSDLLSVAGGTLELGNSDRTTLFRRAEDHSGEISVSGWYPMFISDAQLAGQVSLRPDDSVVVPAELGFVQVEGTVVRPGLYPYLRGKTIDYYIDLAGGVTDRQTAQMELYDRISGLSRTASSGQIVSDGDRITIRFEEQD